jgi:hypothetical protein
MRRDRLPLACSLALCLCLAALHSSAQTTKQTGGAPFPLPVFENELLAEINLARTRPQEYAAYLEQLRPGFKGKTFMLPGNLEVTTQEGAAALDEAIGFLKVARPLPPLAASQGMTLGANLHVRDQGARGLFGHQGTDGSLCEQRIGRFGRLFHTASTPPASACSPGSSTTASPRAATASRSSTETTSSRASPAATTPSAPPCASSPSPPATPSRLPAALRASERTDEQELKKAHGLELSVSLFIGMPRFELGTSPTPRVRATRLRHIPKTRIVSPEIFVWSTGLADAFAASLAARVGGGGGRIEEGEEVTHLLAEA